jgi:soluble lytic murein transglycosylase-like protein
VASDATQQPSPQELQWISKQIPYSDLPAYAKLQSDKNDIFGSLLTLTEWLSRTPQPSISFSLLQLFYPTATLEQIQNQLQKNSPEDSQAKLNHQSLNSLWILSLIKQESGFNTQAISSSGALGLMQLMPFTASEQDPNRWKSEFLKPEYNLPSGILYLQKLQKKYASYKNFQMALILAAYNSGPHRVDQWLKQRPLLAQATELDKILWIETIPYKETREYVQAIFRNYYWYSYLVNTTKPTVTIQTRDPVEFSEPSLF